MKPQTARFLEKAQRLLTEGETMLGVTLHDAAGRTAYLAGFHAAQALIFERLGTVAKTHSGVQSEFLRLTKHDPGFSTDLRGFLSRAYNLKAIADYETGPNSGVSSERASDAVRSSRCFVEHVAGLIGSGQTEP